MKRPRVSPQEILQKPAARVILNYLVKNEEPERLRAARQELQLSIGQFGLAVRALEGHGLAQRRSLYDDSTGAPKLRYEYYEATDLGRELATLSLESTSPVPPAVGSTPV